MKRRALLATRYDNEVTHSIISNILSDEAVETEIPTPVPIAT
jgi:hypothetical protein